MSRNAPVLPSSFPKSISWQFILANLRQIGSHPPAALR